MIKNRILSALAAVAIGFASVIPVFAEPAEETAPMKEKTVLADFEDGDNGWSSNDASVPMQMVRFDERGSVAFIEASKYHTLYWRGVMQNFSEPLDLFCYHAVSVDVFIEPIAEGETIYYAKAIFRSESDEVEYRSETIAGEWTSVKFDISDLYFREKINSIEISFFADSELVEQAPLEKIYIDDIVCTDPLDEEMVNIYMCEEFRVYGGTLERDADGMLKLEIEASNPSVEGDIYVRNSDEKNAVRFVIDNASDAKEMTLFYSDNTEFTTARHICLDAKEGYGVYVFELPSGYRPTRLKLLFEGAGEGEVTIISASMVSVYDSGILKRGEIDTCVIDDGSVVVKGRVEYNTAVGFSGASLALYELEMWEDERELSDKIPVSTTAMSTRFEFYIPASDSFSPTVKYAVALLPDNESAPVLIDTAKYISNPEIYATASEINEPASIKGIAFDNISFAKATGAESVVLDLYLDKLSSGKHTGYLHTVSVSFLYLDMRFVDRIDTVIKNYSNAGIAVYLRLLAEDGGRLVSLRASTPDTIARAVAAVDFLSSRYNSTPDGRISGFVIGTKTDLESEYNDMGGLTLDEYIGEMAKVLRLVSNTAKMNNSSLVTMLSLSDTFFYDRYTEDHLHGKLYDKQLFIEGLSEALSEGGDMEWLIFWESENYFADESFERVCVSNLYMLTEFIAECKEKYTAAPDSIVYCYTPSDYSSFGALYAYSYYTLFYDAQVSGFVISLDPDKISGKDAELVKYIDTAKGLELSLPYLAHFGANSWGELVAGMTNAHAAPIRLIESEITKERPDRIKGTATLWDFGSAHSALGWQTGIGCVALSNTRTVEGSLLEASFDGSGSIIYPYSFGFDISIFSHIALELMLDRDSEITLTIAGKGFFAESRVMVSAGERAMLVADISEIPDGAEVEYIEISLDTDRLCVTRIDAYSRTHSSEELFEIISDIPDTAEQTFNPIWLVAIATVVILSIAAAILIARKERN